MAFSAWRGPGLEFSLLGGFRYLDLQEQFFMLTNKLVLAIPPVPDSTFTTDDHFNTRNQFYGAQVGGRLHWRRDVITLDVTGKLALGDTHQTVDVQGDSTQSGPKAAPAGSFPGGFYAQPSNMGTPRRISSRWSPPSS